MGISIKRQMLLCAVGLLATLFCFSRWGHDPFSYSQQSDIYPRWVGSRELFLNGLDPYSDAVTHQIQLMYYGRPLALGEDRDQQRFAYPVYVAFLLLPTTLLPFKAVQALFVTFLALATVIGVILWLRTVGWPVSKSAVTVIVLLALLNPGTLRGLRLQQLGLLVAALLAAAAFFAVRGRLVTAGVCLGLATIKPQTMLLPLIWFLIWCVGDWVKRKPLALTFAGTVCALFLAGDLLLYGWLWEFVGGVIAYRRYAGYTGLEILFGRGYLAFLCAALVILWMVLRMWRHRTADADSPQFISQLGAVLAIQLFVMPGLFDFYNLVLLLPAIFILLKPKHEAISALAPA
jgi:hypothetical protein